jgi:type III secretion protein V
MSMLHRGDVGGFLQRYSDVALAGVVVLIVAMMIIPLPTVILDLLIAVNMSVAVILLLVSIYVSDALKIATFPTILLITTLFRLGLEVSATRLILIKADAGHIIHAFGNFVVAGNLVVGAVIFFILPSNRSHRSSPAMRALALSRASARASSTSGRATGWECPGFILPAGIAGIASAAGKPSARARRTPAIR